MFYNYNKQGYESLFPLVISDSSGLGVDFVLMRAGEDEGYGGGQQWEKWMRGYVAIDLAALSHLDEVRTAELTQLRENLKPIKSEFVNDRCIF
jgi:hypothetical protein